MSLNSGNTLSLVISNLDDCGNGIGENIYAPGLTDANLPAAKSVAGGGATFTFVAPSTGVWTLYISSYYCATAAYDHAATVTEGAPSSAGSGGTPSTQTPKVGHTESSPKPLTRAQKYARAVKVCDRIKNKHKRVRRRSPSG